MTMMNGKLDGIALRVPVPTGSLTAVPNGEPSIDEINAVFAAASSHERLAEVIEYTEDLIVSSDIVTSDIVTSTAGVNRLFASSQNVLRSLGCIVTRWNSVTRRRGVLHGY